MLQKASSKFSMSLQALIVTGKQIDLTSRANVDPDEALELLRGLGDIGSRVAVTPSQQGPVSGGSVFTESALRQLHLWFCHVRSLFTSDVVPSFCFDIPTAIIY